MLLFVRGNHHTVLGVKYGVWCAVVMGAWHQHLLAREITERPRAPTPPVRSRHSCQPTVKLYIVPLVWIFPLGMG